MTAEGCKLRRPATCATIRKGRDGCKRPISPVSSTRPTGNGRQRCCLPRAAKLGTFAAVSKVHHETVSVRYAETDRMGVAHHSSYLLWFELARTGLLREAGHAYRDLESNDVRLPVIEYGCRFLRSADYDDTLVIETRLRGAPRRRRARQRIHAPRLRRRTEQTAPAARRRAARDGRVCSRRLSLNGSRIRRASPRPLPPSELRRA